MAAVAAVLWSLQYFLCGHTIRDLGVAIGRMWKLYPGSIHPNSPLLFNFTTFTPTCLVCLCSCLLFLFSLYISLSYPLNLISCVFLTSTLNHQFSLQPSHLSFHPILILAPPPPHISYFFFFFCSCTIILCLLNTKPTTLLMHVT